MLEPNKRERLSGLGLWIERKREMEESKREGTPVDWPALEYT